MTSFRAAPGDKDGVRIYDPATGDFIRQIDYYDDPVNDLRVSAQAILFGPDGKLYAPMLQTGEVRAYDVTNDTLHDVHRCRHGLDQSVLHDVRPDQSQHAGLWRELAWWPRGSRTGERRAGRPWNSRPARQRRHGQESR